MQRGEEVIDLVSPPPPPPPLPPAHRVPEWLTKKGIVWDSVVSRDLGSHPVDPAVFVQQIWLEDFPNGPEAANRADPSIMQHPKASTSYQQFAVENVLHIDSANFVL